MRLPVFKGLTPRVIRDVAQLMERRTYRVGSFIFQQGDEAECLYVLASGSVRIVRQMTVPIMFAQHHSTVCPLPLSPLPTVTFPSQQPLKPPQLTTPCQFLPNLHLSAGQHTSSFPMTHSSPSFPMAHSSPSFPVTHSFPSFPMTNSSVFVTPVVTALSAACPIIR